MHMCMPAHAFQRAYFHAWRTRLSKILPGARTIFNFNFKNFDSISYAPRSYKKSLAYFNLLDDSQ